MHSVWRSLRAKRLNGIQLVLINFSIYSFAFQTVTCQEVFNEEGSEAMIEQCGGYVQECVAYLHQAVPKDQESNSATTYYIVLYYINIVV